MIAISGLLGGLGLMCMLMRRTLLGFLIGIQLLILGSTSVFVLAGVASGAGSKGHLFGLFIWLGGVGQLVVGYALATGLFYLMKMAGMEDLRSLKN